MRDILPGETHVWEGVEDSFRRVAGLYDFSEVRIPVLEPTSLFSRSIGDETDIVGKEMYSFTDRGGADLSLRPEGTAGAVRAYVENGVGGAESVTKWYYLGPMFRRERPQKGRYRQFHQAGAEVFGAPPPFVDAELAIMLIDFFGVVGLEGATVLYNHLGGETARARFRDALIGYFGSHEAELCEDCRRRLGTNPLRLLDCKVETCKALHAQSPRMSDSLEPGDVEVLERYADLLGASGVPARESPRLVRGLDYYNGIVFEVEVATADGPVVIAGGGRYDGLVGRLGGPETPAAGYAIGLERLIGCVEHSTRPAPDVFVIVPDAGAETVAARLLHDSRSRGLRSDMDPRAGSFKSQMKRAGKLGARWTVILGAAELERGHAGLKDMDSGEQEEVPIETLAETVAGRCLS